jgi:pyridoxal phosphate enzyme (YggS family)
MSTPSLESFTRNLHEVRERVAQAAARSGRRPDEVLLMAVTKSFPEEAVHIAVGAGQRLFGENRVQEAAAKYDRLRDLELHLIGHLQRNKARQAAELFAGVHSIDKLDTALALEKACAAVGRSMDVLLELNTSGEPTKFGFASADALRASVEPVLAMAHLRLRGLMTVGPFTTELDRIRAAFSQLRELYERLQGEYPGLQLDTLSMGMSADFEAAVEEGSTLVRLGSALFGPRETG